MIDNDKITNPTDRFRAALCINAMPKIIDSFLAKEQSIPQLEAGDTVTYMYSLYREMNRQALEDTRAHPSEKRRPGDIPHNDEQEHVKKCLGKLIHAFFDSNKFPKSLAPGVKDKAELRHIAAEHLAAFYLKMRDHKPFAYGNEITLTGFLTYFGRLKSFESAVGKGNTLDFRALNHDEAEVLRVSYSLQEITKVFESALDPERVPLLDNIENEYGTLGNKSVKIAEINFLGYEKDGIDYLVTVNGGLVERQKAEAAFLRHRNVEKGKISEFAIIPDEYLDVAIDIPNGDGKYHLKDTPWTVNKNGEKVQVIDGYEVHEDGSAPLVCLDADIRTGLHKADHEALEKYLKSIRIEDKPIESVHYLDKPENVDKVREFAPENIKKLIDIAAPHIKAITDQINAAKDSLFEPQKKDPDRKIASVPSGQKAQLIMSMGGPGSGKGAVSEVAEALTNNNYVEASLDKSRSFSKLYHVLGAVGHHADDYALVEKFAFAVREWTAKKAKGEHFNLLYDGTGVDFKPRYEDLARDFRKANYNTTVCMVDSMFIVPDARKDECQEGVFQRIQNRLAKGDDQRILPWNITINKHRGVMRSFLDAFQSPEVDKAVAFCSDGEMSQRYILAESFKATDNNEYFPMENTNGSGEAHFGVRDARNMLRGEDSITRTLAKYTAQKSNADGRGGKSTDLDEWNKAYNKIPALTNNNVTVMYDRHAGENRGLLMTNVTRMVDIAQKAMLNGMASGPSTLLKLPEQFSFVVPQKGLFHTSAEGEIPLQLPPPEYTASVKAKYNGGMSSHAV